MNNVVDLPFTREVRALRAGLQTEGERITAAEFLQRADVLLRTIEEAHVKTAESAAVSALARQLAKTTLARAAETLGADRCRSIVGDLKGAPLSRQLQAAITLDSEAAVARATARAPREVAT